MRWICLISGSTAVVILALVVLTIRCSENGRQGKVVTVVEGAPSGFEQPRYVGWVFGRMIGINSSDFTWPAPSPSSQLTSDAP